MRQLRTAIERAVEEARVGVLFGHGANFSAGLDLAEAVTWLGADQETRRKRRGRWHPVLDTMARGSIPWVAALKGACIGGGLEIASAAHIRVADETTFFALPEGQRGIFVGGGGSVRIQRLLGYARMADLMLTGRVLTAAGRRALQPLPICRARRANRSSARRSLAARIAKNAPLTNWAIAACLPRVNDLRMKTASSWKRSSARRWRSAAEPGAPAGLRREARRAAANRQPGKSGAPDRASRSHSRSEAMAWDNAIVGFAETKIVEKSDSATSGNWARKFSKRCWTSTGFEKGEIDGLSCPRR